MSQVGYVEKMFGNTFNIVTTNAPGNKIISNNEATTLIKNSLIIASPINENNFDKNTPSLVATDFDGNPLRLTYSMMPGNGLIIDNDEPDIMKMLIDNKSIKTNNVGGLRVDTTYLCDEGLYDNNKSSLVPYNNGNQIKINPNVLIDNYSIKLCSPWISDDPFYKSQDGEFDNWEHISYKFYVNKENLVDNETLYVDYSYAEKHEPDENDIPIYMTTTYLRNGTAKLKVSTQKLDKASSTTYGVVKLDGNTIKTDNLNRIYVDTSKLQKVNSGGGVGIIRVKAQNDSSEYIYATNDGLLRVKPEKMPKAGTKTVFGVASCDGTTIKSNTGVLSVITDGLNDASETNKGVVKVDGKTIRSNAGTIRVDTTYLTSAKTTTYGVVKLDNSSIKMYENGQIYVTDAAKWNSGLEELRVKYDGLSTQFNELQSAFISFKSSITNSFASNFGLYKDVAGTISVSNIVITFGWWYTQTSTAAVIQIPLYMKYMVGSEYSFTFDKKASWITNPHLIIYNDTNNIYELYPENGDALDSGEIKQIYLSLTVTKTSSASLMADRTDSCTLNFYDVLGEVMKSVSINITFKANTYESFEQGLRYEIRGLTTNNQLSVDPNTFINNSRQFTIVDQNT